MYQVDYAGQESYEESVAAVNILDGLKVEEHNIVSTTNEPDSLLDVKRCQRTQHLNETN